MKSFLFLVGLLFTTYIQAEDNIFEKITTREGLSQNDVNCIFQDHYGFLWIGTNDGLNRYDGYSFTTFRIDIIENGNNDLPSNIISKISEASNGDLWISTANNGVCKFNIETETFTSFNNTLQPDILADDRILDIQCYLNGTIWVGTTNGLSILSEENNTYKSTTITSHNNSHFKSDIINVISEDNYGRKWVGTSNGIVLFTEQQNKQRFQCLDSFGES